MNKEMTTSTILNYKIKLAVPSALKTELTVFCETLSAVYNETMCHISQFEPWWHQSDRQTDSTSLNIKTRSLLHPF